MSLLITIVVVLVILGLCLWLVSLIPMAATLQRIVQAIMIIIAILYILGAAGILNL